MNFGSYFKNLRKSKHITQQQIANAIGKSKMLVSGVETNKNAPFIDEDLKFIVDVLSLSEEDERKLYKGESQRETPQIFVGLSYRI